jgi:NAD+ kinase
MSKRILLVSKTPLLQQLEPAMHARLAASGAVEVERLRQAADNHEATLQAVRRGLTGHKVNEWQVDRLQPQDAVGKDLVVTVGGDGTVLTANSLDTDTPLLTVNSDLAGSIGKFTRCTAQDFADLFAAWVEGRARLEALPRLQVRIEGGTPWRVLNDCLISSANPAAMTRYLLEADGQREIQRSSGVWVATAAGSTAAIHSAGLAPWPEVDAPALLFKVREPFHGQRPLTLLEGRQAPPRGLRLTAAMPGISVFIDGPHLHRGVLPGATVEIGACPTPLNLVAMP